MHPHHRPIAYLLRALFLLLCAVFALIVPRAAQAQGVRTPVRVLEHPADITFAEWGASHLLTVVNDAVYVWDVDQGGDPVILPHDGPVSVAAWNRSGDRILTLTQASDVVRAWNADGGDPLVLHHDARVQGARWSPDGTRVLTWDWNAAVLAWPIMESGDPVVIRPPRTDDDDWRLPILQAEWSLDGESVFGYEFGDDYVGETVYRWAADGSGMVAEFQHDAAINGMIQGSGFLLTWSNDRTARLWRLDDPTAEPIVFEHATPVYHAAWDGFVNLFVTLDAYGRVWAWTWDTQGVYPVRLNHPDGAYAVAGIWFYADSTCATWAGDIDTGRNEVRVWGMTRLHYEEPIVLHHPAAINGVAWHSYPIMLLTWADDNVARVYDRLIDERVDFIALPHETHLDGAAWSFDESQVVTWSGSQVFVWSPFEEQ